MKAIDYLLEYPRFSAPGTIKRMQTMSQGLHLLPWWRDKRCIKVVGSNAKGTTAHLISSLAQKMGKTVGLFTSPHLLHVEERIQINGDPISRKQFEEHLDWALDVAFGMDGVGRFELLTLSALNCFAQNNVDLAVMEVGLGGRLDPVRVAPGILSVLTSIDLEHQEILGDTLEKIAFEKASVCKSGDCLISGYDILAESVPENVDVINLSNKEEDPLKKNLVLAQKAIELFFDEEPPTLDVRAENLPGRLQQISSNPDIFLDVAHTPKALETLITHLPDQPITLICGARKDKDLENMVRLVKPRTHALVAFQANDEMVPAHEILEAFGNVPKKNSNNAQEALKFAKDLCCKDSIILCLGGFTLASEILAHQQGYPLENIVRL